MSNLLPRSGRILKNGGRCPPFYIKNTCYGIILRLTRFQGCVQTHVINLQLNQRLFQGVQVHLGAKFKERRYGVNEKHLQS